MDREVGGTAVTVPPSERRGGGTVVPRRKHRDHDARLRSPDARRYLRVLLSSRLHRLVCRWFVLFLGRAASASVAALSLRSFISCFAKT